jgi:hypothetical protein
MKLNEEKELNKITTQFSEAIKQFSKKDFKKAKELFADINSTYGESEFYSVLEIFARSKIYHSIAEAQLNPIKLELKSDEDYLNEGLFQLNAGDLERALELFNHLKSKKYGDPFVDYLMALAFLKSDDIDASLKHLKICFDQDESYKILAQNESDFDPLYETEEFQSLIE